MTIELTDNDIEEQFQEAEEEQLQWDPSDELDITHKFGARISQGWRREVWLREGILLFVDQHKLNDVWILNSSGGKRDTIKICFSLSGQKETLLGTSPCKSVQTKALRRARTYEIGSSGLLDKKKTVFSDVEQHNRFYIEIRPEIIRSFVSNSDGELPGSLQHLIKSSNEAAYVHNRGIQSSMNAVIHQFLQCPYQGVVKRAYLESKTIELVALVLDHEIAIQQGEVKKGALKPEQIERIHYAREILLRDMGNPPSLAELAQQAGLNDFMLRQGFHQAFGTTVFGQLQAYRLDVAKQLLAEQDTSVSEVARQVGYTSVSYFSRAFKKKFGTGPKAYQRACR